MALLRDLMADRNGQPLTREELLQEMRRFYGLAKLGKTIRAELSGDIRAAVRRGIIDNTAGRYSPLCRTTDQATSPAAATAIARDRRSRPHGRSMRDPRSMAGQVA